MKKFMLIILTCIAVRHSTFAQFTIKLFDGKTTNGWHPYLTKGAGAWEVVNGMLQLDPKAEGQGDLLTNKEYEKL